MIKTPYAWARDNKEYLKIDEVRAACTYWKAFSRLDTLLARLSTLPIVLLA